VDRSEWSPTYRALWDYCSAKPDAVEEHPWGETVFKVKKKVFAFIGHPDGNGVTVKSPPDALEHLLSLPNVRPCGYNLGKYGWVTITITDDETLEMALRLVDSTYDSIAGKTKRRKGK